VSPQHTQGSGPTGFRGWWVQQPRLGKIAFVGSIPMFFVALIVYAVIATAVDRSRSDSGSGAQTQAGKLDDYSTCDDWYSASSAERDEYAQGRADLSAEEAATGEPSRTHMIQVYCEMHDATGQGPDALGDYVGGSPYDYP
jgi:hypothetical protein